MITMTSDNGAGAVNESSSGSTASSTAASSITETSITETPATDRRTSGGGSARAAAVEPFLRGCAWPSGQGVPYPRADTRDFTRLPIDTWSAAMVPVGVRLEFTGAACAVQIAYRTKASDPGYRGAGAGTTFAAYQGEQHIVSEPAVFGDGLVTLDLSATDENQTTVVYLPEGMKPEVVSLHATGGELVPAAARPRWICYGDSITEGWSASEPAGAWSAIAGRTHDLDVVNLGYAGGARGEIVSAEMIAALGTDDASPAGPPAVISINHGTNCWSRVPHTATMMMAGMDAFLRIVREGHPGVPIVVCSPVLRPDAERTKNRLGATLEDLREALEDAVQGRRERGDTNLTLVTGDGVLRSEHLVDGIHPGDEGHQILARVFGDKIAAAAAAGTVS